MRGAPFAVVWDLDGTLVDTSELHFESWRATAAELGVPFTRTEFARSFGRRNPEIIREVLGQSAPDDVLAAIADRKERQYRAAAAKGVALLAGARELVSALAAAGVSQALGTSAPRANAELLLRVTGVASSFRALVTEEDVRRGKPDPEVFVVAAARVHAAAAQTVVLEDAPAGIAAAHAGGMIPVGVLLASQADEAALVAAGARLVVPSLAALTVERLAALVDEAPLRSHVRA